MASAPTPHRFSPLTRRAPGCALAAALAAAALLAGCAQRPLAEPARAAAPAEVHVSGELALRDAATATFGHDAVAVVEVRDAAQPAAAPLATWRLPLAGRALPLPFNLTLPAAPASLPASASASASAASAPASASTPPAVAPAADTGTSAPAASRPLLLQARIEEAGRATWVAEPLAVQLPAGAGTLDAGSLPLAAQRVAVVALRCGRQPLVAELVGQALRLRWPLSADAAPRAVDLAPAPAASGARWQAADPATWAWNKGTRWSVSLQGRTLPECRPASATAPAMALQPALRARGHEPSWQLELGGSRLRLHLPERNRPLDAATPAPRAILGGWHWQARSAGEPLAVTVHERTCRDTMTGLPHPLAVSVQRGDRRFDGCGGQPGTLLRGSWRVTHLDGQPLGAEPRAVTLVFDAPAGRAERTERTQRPAAPASASAPAAPAAAAPPAASAAGSGRVTGRAPCNDYSGRWTVDEALRFAQVAATRRACAPEVSARETAFFQILKAARSFDLRADGRLRLSGNGRELTAVRD